MPATSRPAPTGQGTYEYSQSHKPVREQTKVVGHAVRALYMYTAMADLAAELGDASLKRACETLWKDVTSTRMYVTGGFGPSASNEGFTSDYDLPNDTAYAETCASVAMIFWAQRMLNLDLDGEYADTLERVLYNGALSGLSRDGENYFYDNKLESDGSHRRWAWHACPCCTMNVSRLVASVGGYFYSVGANVIAVHLYGGNTAELEMSGRKVRIEETSSYPWSGAIRIAVHPEGSGPFSLRLRVPAWAHGASATVNGAPIDVARARPAAISTSPATGRAATPSSSTCQWRPSASLRTLASAPMSAVSRSATGRWSIASRHRQSRHSGQPARPAPGRRTVRRAQGYLRRHRRLDRPCPRGDCEWLEWHALPRRSAREPSGHPHRGALLSLGQPRAGRDGGLGPRGLRRGRCRTSSSIA